MSRYRLVTTTTTAGGMEEHVSSVVQTHAEALADMEAEEHVASLAGWHTARLVTLGRPHPILVCNRGGTVRTITIRETGPFDDTL